MFDWEHGIALNAIQGNWASSVERGKSHGFLELLREPGVYSRVVRGSSFNARVCSATSGLLSSYEETSGISMRLGRAIRMLLEVKRVTEGPFLVATVVLGFLLIFFFIIIIIFNYYFLL